MLLSITRAGSIIPLRICGEGMNGRSSATKNALPTSGFVEATKIHAWKRLKKFMIVGLLRALSSINPKYPDGWVSKPSMHLNVPTFFGRIGSGITNSNGKRRPPSKMLGIGGRRNMASRVTKTVVITCDKCKNSIDESVKYIDAMTYGCTFHVPCFKEMTAHELVQIMQLDEIKLMRYDDWEHAEKIYSKSFKL